MVLTRSFLITKKHEEELCLWGAWWIKVYNGHMGWARVGLKFRTWLFKSPVNIQSWYKVKNQEICRKMRLTLGPFHDSCIRLIIVGVPGIFCLDTPGTPTNHFSGWIMLINKVEITPKGFGYTKLDGGPYHAPRLMDSNRFSKVTLKNCCGSAIWTKNNQSWILVVKFTGFQGFLMQKNCFRLHLSAPQPGPDGTLHTLPSK